MCAGFQVLKDTEKSGKALALPFCKRFLRKLSASGRWTNRKTIRQTLSNRFWKSRKVQHLFLHNLPEKKKMNNTWQYSFIKRIPPVMIRLPIEMRMNIPVHERIKILVIWDGGEPDMPGSVKKEQKEAAGLFWIVLFFHESDRYTF